MERYKLLICDDEWMIREQIKQCACEDDCFEVFTADSGLRALETLAHNRIDGMILDVRMPEMDGISLLKELQQEADPVIVILSGHDEFEYAQQCLHYGASEYLLKPVTDAQLRALLEDLKGRIRRKQQYAARIREYTNQLDAIKPVLKKQFLSQLLQKTPSPESIRRMEQFLGMRVAAPYMAVAVVSIRLTDGRTADGQNLLQYYAVGELLEAQLQEKINANLFFGDNEIMTVIASGNTEQLHVQLSSAMDETLEKLAGDIGLQYYAGVGKTVCSVQKIRQSYTQALYALNSGSFEQENGTLGIQDVLPCMDAEKNKREIRSALREIMTLGAVIHNQEMLDRLRSLLDSVAESSPDLDTAVFYCSYAAVLALDRLDTQSAFFRQNPIHAITSATTVEEVCAYTKKLLEEIGGFIVISKQKRAHHLAEKCREIIERDYGKKIGVVEIAEQMGVSCNYLSTLFRRETQYSINEYLNAVRLKHAKRMLRDTNLKVYEIAEQVGFSDTYYFSSVFKKHIGVAPSDYRNSLL